MFTTGDLARRIEAAEASLTLAVAKHVRALRPERDVLAVALGGGAAAFAGGSPFDKVIGLGFADLAIDELATFEQSVLSRGGAVQVEHCSLADPAVGRALTERGYVLVGFENVLGLRLDETLVHALAARPASEATVEPVAASESDRWVDLMADGFSHPDVFDGPAGHESFPRDAVVAVMRDVAGAGGFLPFFARRSGVLSGGANMRLHDGIAQLAGATTLPEHRRRGVQTELLRARLVHAAKAGCDLAVVTTQPGSVSQKNVMREGFSLLYVRAVLVKSP